MCSIMMLLCCWHHLTGVSLCLQNAWEERYLNRESCSIHDHRSKVGAAVMAILIVYLRISFHLVRDLLQGLLRLWLII